MSASSVPVMRQKPNSLEAAEQLYALEKCWVQKWQLNDRWPESDYTFSTSLESLGH